LFGFAVEGKERQQEIRENIQKASKDIAERRRRIFVNGFISSRFTS
jgi:hypothetical protein